ncbi:hypothetical protein COBT_003043 [Conglomerata obtusa]
MVMVYLYFLIHTNYIWASSGQLVALGYAFEQIITTPKIKTPVTNTETYFDLKMYNKLINNDTSYSLNTKQYNQRHKRNLQRNKADSLDNQISIEPNFLHNSYADAANLGPYIYGNISYAANFYNLLQIIIPGLSILSEEEIMYPTPAQLLEIFRLKEMINLKGKISLYNVKIEQIKSEIKDIKFQLSLDDQIYTKVLNIRLKNLEQTKDSYLSKITSLIEKFRTFWTEQNLLLQS